jgi:hypothetical protein
MRRFPPVPNLTAVLAVAALAELGLYRITSAIFLPSQDGTTAERWLAGTALYMSNLSGILALVLAAVALLRALGADNVFPRSMRITVSTIGLFFCALAAIGVLWSLAPQYAVHLRISHGFLAFFLTLGVWHGARPWRFKVGITLFAVPIVLQAIAIFVLRMGWARPNPTALAQLGHAIALLAMVAAPVLLTPRPWTAAGTAVALAVGLLAAAGLGAAILLRFDLVQAALFYGLRIDLTGLASTAEQIYSGAIVAAFACVAAGITGCLLGKARARLAGWGLLLIAVAGAEITSPKPALFTLCGLLALAVAGSANSCVDADVASQGSPSAV